MRSEELRDLQDGAEQLLVAQLRDGNPEAFAELVVQYADRLTRLAVYMTGARDTADEVVQRVFVELWERRATLNPGRLAPYLFRAVHNRALDERKAAAVRSRFRDAGIAGTSVEPSPEERILAKAVVWTAVDQLSERRRLAVRLRFTEQMTHTEIGQVLGISPLAARLLVTRALSELRTILEK